MAVSLPSILTSPGAIILLAPRVCQTVGISLTLNLNSRLRLRSHARLIKPADQGTTTGVRGAKLREFLQEFVAFLFQCVSLGQIHQQVAGTVIRGSDLLCHKIINLPPVPLEILG